jgi:hypothetical protein
MLMLRPFLKGRDLDHLHTLKGERGKRRNVVNMSRGKAKDNLLPGGPEMLKSSPMLGSVYSHIKELLRKSLSKYKL